MMSLHHYHRLSPPDALLLLPKGADTSVQGRQKARARSRADVSTTTLCSGRRLPSHSPSASPARPSPRTRRGDGPQEGQGHTAWTCYTRPVKSEAAPTVSHPIRLRTTKKKAARGTTAVRFPIACTCSSRASLSQSINYPKCTQKAEHAQNRYLGLITPRLSPLTHVSALPPTSPRPPQHATLEHREQNVLSAQGAAQLEALPTAQAAPRT